MRIVRFLHNGTPTHAIDHGDTLELANGDLFNLQPTGQSVDRPAKLLAPLVPTDILCIGLNYKKHAEETGSTPPENPMLFIKASGALAGPDDVVTLPGNSRKVDFEAELVVIVGKDAKDISEADAFDYIFGYTLANDVSARDWQKDKPLNGGQFSRGKSFDGFCPLGPAIVTKDEVADPDNLRIQGRLNGETMQDSSTADMIFSVAKILSSLSETMTVKAGSIILTGTPEGVGAARKPPVFLKAGDTYDVEIESLGTLTTRFN